MPIDTSNDRAGTLRGRNPEAVFTEGAEESNVSNQQGLMGDLFFHKDEMARRCKEQLGGLFSNDKNSYGRARAVGMTASEASKLVTRAHKG